MNLGAYGRFRLVIVPSLEIRRRRTPVVRAQLRFLAADRHGQDVLRVLQHVVEGGPHGDGPDLSDDLVAVGVRLHAGHDLAGLAVVHLEDGLAGGAGEHLPDGRPVRSVVGRDDRHRHAQDVGPGRAPCRVGPRGRDDLAQLGAAVLAAGCGGAAGLGGVSGREQDDGRGLGVGEECWALIASAALERAGADGVDAASGAGGELEVPGG